MFFSALHRGVLGVLLFALGVVFLAAGVAAFGGSPLRNAGGVALVVLGLLSFVGVVALFVEGYREGRDAA